MSKPMWLPAFTAILGMYTLMSNKQYYDALGTTGTIANTEGINSTYDAAAPPPAADLTAALLRLSQV